jgi:hypothetical protein
VDDAVGGGVLRSHFVRTARAEGRVAEHEQDRRRRVGGERGLRSWAPDPGTCGSPVWDPVLTPRTRKALK